MQLPLFQVDAFAREPLSGNPAAVCPLDAWIDEATMQAIAMENNLSETAFFVPKPAEPGAYDLRWFTPNSEVDLCGHATLASAYVVLNHLRPDEARVAFDTKSGRLIVRRDDDGLFVMDFPSEPPEPVTPPEPLLRGLGATPEAVLASTDYVAVFDGEAAVAGLNPDLTAFCALDRRGVAVTAPGEDADYVLRFFAPKNAVPEDPVTGSVQTALAPYWSRRLDKPRLAVRQLSARGGEMICEDKGERVEIAGRAALYMTATITI